MNEDRSSRLTSGRRRASRGGWLLGAVIAAAVVMACNVATAQEDEQRFDNRWCLGCHDVPELPVALPSGETLDAAIDPEVYAGSVHGELGLPCALCHTEIAAFPHRELQAQTRRDVSLDLYESCFGCHQEQYTATLDNVHAAALEQGVPAAAVCTDCHGAHDVTRPDPRGTDIQLTCRNCHSEVYELYASSVHGAALVDGNGDVPTCTDCHSVHDVAGPSDSAFHLFSPQICAGCHEDGDLMAPYGLSTAVLETYVADFHGTTVELFEAVAPDQETNKPVCIDCHGVHSIVATDDPASTVFQENLLGTCQRCHPDATTNFPTAWLSHYQPSTDEAPLVFFARAFYRIAIPAVIGSMVAFVALDARRRRIARRELRRG